MSEIAADYPLGETASGTLRAASGRLLAQIDAAALAGGELSADDLRIHAETLRGQAAIAARAGYPQLAANLRRAAELSAVPNEEVLRMYEMLRPGRATYQALCDVAERLESSYAAFETAAFVREAAEVYRERGLVQRS
jgi:propanediol dehydratase small subunit